MKEDSEGLARQASSAGIQSDFGPTIELVTEKDLRPPCYPECPPPCQPVICPVFRQPGR